MKNDKIENLIWNQSVAGLVIRDGNVLLVRHTYGNGKDQLIIPGGFVNQGETPQNAVIRELHEETGITVEVKDIVAVRFNMHDWYIVFNAIYVTGNEQSDRCENSEVVWIDINSIQERTDVPELTKKVIESHLKNYNALQFTEYETNTVHSPYSLYC